MIKSTFWASHTICRLSLSARLFFIGLWTFADDYGCLNDSDKGLCGQIFPNDESITPKQIKQWKKELVAQNLILCRDGYIVIRSWKEHQYVDHPSKSRVLSEEQLNAFLEAEPSASPSPERSGPPNPKSLTEASPDDAEKILAYWRAWVDRPTDKKQTLANIRKALKAHSAEALAFAIAKYKKSFDEERKDAQYLYKGSNFFGEAAYFEAFLPAPEELEDRRQEFRSALDTVILGPAPKAAA